LCTCTTLALACDPGLACVRRLQVRCSLKEWEAGEAVAGQALAAAEAAGGDRSSLLSPVLAQLGLIYSRWGGGRGQAPWGAPGVCWRGARCCARAQEVRVWAQRPTRAGRATCVTGVRCHHLRAQPAVGRAAARRWLQGPEPAALGCPCVSAGQAG